MCVGPGAHCARTAATPAPTRKPSVRDSPARRAPEPPSDVPDVRAAASVSSLIHVVPTAMTRPSATPHSTRPAARRAADDSPAASTSDPASATGAAGSSRGRRPYRSESGPPSRSAGTIPRTYAASSASTVTAEKCPTSRYMTSSGVNSLPPHATANITAATGSHARCPRAARAPGAEVYPSVAAVIVALTGRPSRPRGGAERGACRCRCRGPRARRRGRGARRRTSSHGPGPTGRCARPCAAGARADSRRTS